MDRYKIAATLAITKIYILLLIIFATGTISVVCTSCKNIYGDNENRDSKNITKAKLAIIPLRRGAHLQLKNESVCTLTGMHFISGRIEGGGEKIVTEKAVNYLKKKSNYELIPVEKSVNAMNEMDLLQRDLYDRSLGIKVGEKIGADYVLMGVVVRYENREGGRIFSGKPASVAFSVVLIDVKKKILVWKSAFDKTQKSIMQNLLESDIPAKKRFVWLTAEELSDIGIEKVFQDFPSEIFEQGEKD